MGRKSLAPKRCKQILDAFEECIVQRGLDGASIGAVAERAGIDRTLVHHYFGTRAALETALVHRLVALYKSERDAAVALLPAEDRPRRLLDYLFGAGFNDPRFGVLFAELLSASYRSPSTKALLLRAYQEFEEVASAEIEKAYPQAPARRRRQVAFSIMCLADSCPGFVALGFPADRRRAARVCAEDLLRTLEPLTAA